MPDSGSGTELIIEMMKRQDEKQNELLKELRDTNERMTGFEKDLTRIKDHQPDEDLLYNMRRITGAFEKDDLFQVIYNARSLQTWVWSLATAVVGGAGLALWNYFAQTGVAP